MFDADDTADLTLGFNKDYARKFEYNKERQELEKLKDKYGSDSDQSSTDEEEDDDAEMVTPEADAQILKTIAAIRTKNELVYNAEHQFFDQQVPVVKQQKESALHLDEYNRERLLKGIDTDDNQVTHVREQHQLKQELKRAFDQVQESEDDDLLVVKEKDADEVLEEEGDYKKWLLDNLDSKSSEVLKGRDEEEQFLMDYVMNKGYVGATVQVDEDDSNDEIQAEEFETMYNFRYEELEQKMGAGSSYTSVGKQLLTSHSRHQPESVRRKDTHRIDLRRSKEERLQAEKELKINELRRLKQLKKRELEEMAGKVLKVASTDKKEAVEKLLEHDDFDADDWDAKMQSLFDQAYYEQTDDKPVFSDESDIESQSGQVSETGQISEAVQVPQEAVLEQVEPQERADTKAMLKQLLKDYDELNYEDVQKGLKTRFRYSKVDADDFGLKPDDVLQADDDLLNEHVSLKKMAPYRSDDRHKKWLKKFRSQSKHKVKKFQQKLKQRRQQPKVADPKEKNDRGFKL